MKSPGETKQIFVVGDDAFNIRRLRRLEERHTWRFVPILDYSRITDPNVSLTEKIERSARAIEEHGGDVDGIIAYWEFPHVAIVAKLAERFGTTWPNLDAIVRCQNKYLSRVAQREVIPGATPRFEALDPFEARPGSIGLDYPFWLKPVRSHSSHLGFAIHDDDDLRRALARIEKRVHHLSGATSQLLDMVDIDEAHRHITGNTFLAEEIISGGDARQITAEGVAVPGRAPDVYGIVDSLRYPKGSSFLRYQYPSSLDDAVKTRVQDVCRRVLGHVGFEGGAFNVEFFYEEAKDRLSLLEINPRTSQSHAEMFSWVDGLSNIERLVAVATDDESELVAPGGEWGMAAKCFHRRFDDALVTRVPSQEELDAIEADVPGVRIQIPPTAGQRLSDMDDQDSYSFELALIHVGADDEAGIEEKAQRVIDRLRFDFAERGETHADHRRAAAAGL